MQGQNLLPGFFRRTRQGQFWRTNRWFICSCCINTFPLFSEIVSKARRGTAVIFAGHELCLAWRSVSRALTCSVTNSDKGGLASITSAPKSSTVGGGDVC